MNHLKSLLGWIGTMCICIGFAIAIVWVRLCDWVRDSRS